MDNKHSMKELLDYMRKNVSRKSRFQQELDGDLGDFWKKSAEETLQRRREEIETGEVTFKNGVARWTKSGNIVPDDIVEQFEHVTNLVDRESTKKAHDEETSIFIAKYRESQKNRKYSEEELFEMRAAFGKGAEVVDVITGQRIKL